MERQKKLWISLTISEDIKVSKKELLGNNTQIQKRIIDLEILVEMNFRYLIDLIKLFLNSDINIFMGLWGFGASFATCAHHFRSSMVAAEEN